MPKSVPLFGPGQGYRSRTVSEQRRLNLYLEQQGDPDASSLVMYGTAGLVVAGGVNAPPVAVEPIRGALGVGYNSYSIVVAGQYTYIRLPDGRLAFVGALSTGAGLVSIANNGTQALIVDGASGWVIDYTLGGPVMVAPNQYTWSVPVMTEITAPGFPFGATTATFLAGYFIVNAPLAQNGQFFWSGLYDGLAWDALDFASAETSPDPLIGVRAAHGVLLLLGSSTIEPWAPSGTTTQWQRVGGAAIEWGVPTPWTFDRFGDSEIFLAANHMGQYQIVLLNGLNVVPVSTPDIIHDMNLQSAASVSAATGFSYMLDGHQFYEINFPDKTYQYNLQTDVRIGSWNELQSDGGRHWANLRFEVNNVGLFADYRFRQIYTLDLDAYTDNDTYITRECTMKHVETDLSYITVDSLQIQFQPGVGLATGQGSDPQCMLQVSRDGGATWGFEKWASIGMMGAYLSRVLYRQLGRARDFMFRWRVSDPVKIVVANVAITVR